MTKPSDRIRKLYSKYRTQEDAAHATLFAICDYLDELQEQKVASSKYHEQGKECCQLNPCSCLCHKEYFIAK